MKSNLPERRDSIDRRLKIINANDPKVTSIKLGYFGEDETFIKFFEALKNNEYITSLDLSGNSLGVEAIRALTQLPRIQKVDLFQNGLKSFESIKLLADCPNIVELNIANSCVTDEALEYFWRHTSCRSITVSHRLYGDRIVDEKAYAACYFNRQQHDLKLLNAQFKTQKKPELSREEFVGKTIEEFKAIPQELMIDLGTCYHDSGVWDYGNKAVENVLVADNSINDIEPKKMGMTK